MNKVKQVSYTKAFIAITSLFFMWGFITCLNDLIIPEFKKTFDLTRMESMYVQFCFFGAYFIGSLAYFLISLKVGDIISKIGYKNGVITGLLVAAIGCFLFYPASTYAIYPFFLLGLFVLGLGITLLQIAANPYVTILGSPETASGRLNLSQAFNSLGTTIAPIFGGWLIFTLFKDAGVQFPYLIFGATFLLLAIIIAFLHLPTFKNETQMEKGAGVLKHSHLLLGIFAIFFYVGAEVSIGSSFINHMKEILQMPEGIASHFLSFYWGGLMIGRFLGAISIQSFKNNWLKYGLMLLVALVTFSFLLGVNYVLNPAVFHLAEMYPYLIIILVNLLAFRLGNSRSAITISIFALCAIVLLIGAMLFTGKVTMWLLIGVGIFNSIMWSNIFSISISGLGEHTTQGSSLLVMAVLGGAILPLLLGSFADYLGGYHFSYIIPIIAYLYIAFFGYKTRKIIV